MTCGRNGPRRPPGPLSDSLAICLEAIFPLERGLSGQTLHSFPDRFLAKPRGAAELCRALAVDAAERGTEVAMAGEAERKAKFGQVVILAQQIERTRDA